MGAENWRRADPMDTQHTYTFVFANLFLDVWQWSVMNLPRIGFVQLSKFWDTASHLQICAFDKRKDGARTYWDLRVGFTERDAIIRTRPQACLVQSNCDGKITQVESCNAPDVAFVDEQDNRQEKTIVPSADARTFPTTTCGCLCVDPILQLIMRRTSRKAQLTGSRSVPKASVQNSVIADSMVSSADAQREFNTACPLL